MLYQIDEMNADGSENDKKWQLLHEKLTAMYKRDQFSIHEKVINLHKRLKKKYPYYMQVRLYHLLSMSTVQRPKIHFDFPDEDSVEKFIEQEHAKFFS